MRILRYFARFIVNFVWKITGGIVFALVWLVIGIAFSMTLIGMPIGVKCLKIAYFCYKPFGRQVVVVPTEHIVVSLLWALTVGVVMCLLSIVWLTLLTISIVGIPLILEWYKVMKVSIFPFGVFIM